MRTRLQPRDAATDAGPERPAQPPGRPRKRVRSRLLALVLVCVLTVLVVGTPGTFTAVEDLDESRRLEALGALNGRAVALAHSLADERDEMALFIAQGRSTAKGAGVSEDQRARVDRQADEVRRQLLSADTEGDLAVTRQTVSLGKLLATLPELRQRALSGPGTARKALDTYSGLISALGTLASAVADGLPARAQDQNSRALPALSRAVGHASEQRGLLLTALASGGPQSSLARAAQQAVTREEAALADFETTASGAVREQYAETVTGKDVDDAEALVRRLTNQPRLSPGDRRTGLDDVRSLLTARVDRMRGVESSMAAATAEHLRLIREDDVRNLELYAALTGLAALLVLGLTVQVSRSVTRPLAAVYRSACDLNRRRSRRAARTSSVRSPWPWTGSRSSPSG